MVRFPRLVQMAFDVQLERGQRVRITQDQLDAAVGTLLQPAAKDCGQADYLCPLKTGVAIQRDFAEDSQQQIECSGAIYCATPQQQGAGNRVFVLNVLRPDGSASTSALPVGKFSRMCTYEIGREGEGGAISLQNLLVENQ